MKSKRVNPEPQFVPVHLILESQEEVDAIFAVLNHASLSNLLKMGTNYNYLQEYISEKGWQKFHGEICQHWLYTIPQ